MLECYCFPDPELNVEANIEKFDEVGVSKERLRWFWIIIVLSPVHGTDGDRRATRRT